MQYALQRNFFFEAPHAGKKKLGVGESNLLRKETMNIMNVLAVVIIHVLFNVAI